ncbi:MAG: hypothetical protein IT371_03150 [Deltaproteobacteria bacterium]|nr:hypothetical protein [Deltaproteobacteria bacterium]
MRMRLLLVVLVALAPVGCRTRGKLQLPKSPEEAYREVAGAIKKGNLVRVFELVDRDSQYAVMSIFEAQGRIAELVRSGYPAERQARELERVQLARQSPDVNVFFVGYVKQTGALAALTGLPEGARAEGSGERVTMRAGNRAVPFCKQGDGWVYCGWREQLEEQKLRAIRDLTSVREAVETFRGK